LFNFDLRRNKIFKLIIININKINSRERLAILAQNRDDPTDQIMVFFPSDFQLGMKIINLYSLNPLPFFFLKIQYRISFKIK